MTARCLERLREMEEQLSADQGALRRVDLALLLRQIAHDANGKVAIAGVELCTLEALIAELDDALARGDQTAATQHMREMEALMANLRRAHESLELLLNELHGSGRRLSGDDEAER